MPHGSSFNIPFTITATNVGTNSGVHTSGQICSLNQGAGTCVFGVTTSLVTNLYNAGTIVVMGQTYTVSTNTSTIVSITTTGVTLPFEMVDDDDNTLLPHVPDTGLMVQEYAPAYITPIIDGGGNIANDKQTIAFDANVDTMTNASLDLLQA
jgi:hypothetical protein